MGLFAQPAPAADLRGVQADVAELVALRHSARLLSLDGRRPAASVLAGIQASRLRGRGMDYLESRHYQPGDDLRAMDWRVTARTGRPHTKVYQPERERPVILLADFGPAMFFGTRNAFKSVVAARAAALLAWAAAQRGDRVGAVLFGNGGHRELRPRGGRGGVLGLLHELAACTRGGAAADGGLTDALHRLRRLARPGSLVVMLSDFHGLDAAGEAPIAWLRRHCDLLACQILDLLEQAPPPPGRYAITDGTSRRLLDLRSAAARQDYGAWFAARRQAVAAVFGRWRVPLLSLTTAGDTIDELRRGLEAA